MLLFLPSPNPRFKSTAQLVANRKSGTESDSRAATLASKQATCACRHGASSIPTTCIDHGPIFLEPALVLSTVTSTHNTCITCRLFPRRRAPPAKKEWKRLGWIWRRSSQQQREWALFEHPNMDRGSYRRWHFLCPGLRQRVGHL